MTTYLAVKLCIAGALIAFEFGKGFLRGLNRPRPGRSRALAEREPRAK